MSTAPAPMPIEEQRQLIREMADEDGHPSPPDEVLAKLAADLTLMVEREYTAEQIAMLSAASDEAICAAFRVTIGVSFRKDIAPMRPS